MKRLISVLLAAAMTVSAMSVSAFAEGDERDVMLPEELLNSINALPVYALGEDLSLYEPGDVNLDGKVDAKDATLIAYEFNGYSLIKMGHTLNDVQRSFANVDTTIHPSLYVEIDVCDANAVLRYANYKLIGGEMNAEEFFAAWNAGDTAYRESI
jgi:hypothetical protein